MSLEVVDKPKTTEGEEQTVQYYVNMLQGLSSVQDLPGKKFAEKVADNIKTLNDKLAYLDDLARPSEEFQEFAAKVQGQAMGDPAKIAALEGENPELVKARKDQMAKVDKELASKTFIRLRKIPKNDVPMQVSARQLMALEDILY